MGACCSILALILLVAYGGYKFSIMEGKKSVDLVQAEIENQYDYSYKFGGDDGLNFAVAIMNPFDPNTYKLIDPAYGRIRFRKREGGPTADGGFFMENVEIESHPCTTEELGLTGTDHKIWPVNSLQKPAVEAFKHMFICVDQADLVVMGRLDTIQASLIQADFIKCDSS